MKKSRNKKVIFDIGANKGQNIDYYLAKADIVVAIEANPFLINDIRNKYSKSIKENRLFTESCVLTPSKIRGGGLVDFYFHQNDEQSSVIKPVVEDVYIEKKVRSRSILEVLEKYLNEDSLFYYAKFDIEGNEAKIIESMFESGYFPIYISSEIHTPESFNVIRQSNKYTGYKLIEGSKVPELGVLPIKTRYSIKYTKFEPHTAGPMGDDLPTPWLNEKSMRFKIRIEGCGWKDLHATSLSDITFGKNRIGSLFIAGIKRLIMRIRRRILRYLPV